MSRSPLVFKQTDLTRAIKAVTEAGLQVGSIEITKEGRIVIHTKDGEEPNPKPRKIIL